MKYWVNQIFISLMGGLTGGLAASYLLLVLLREGLGLNLIFDTVILIIVIALLNYGLYYFVFEIIHKKKKLKKNIKW